MQSENITDLAAAMAKAQSEIGGAKKDSTNPHFKSKYADLGAVWDACRGPLTKHGLSVIQQPRSFDGQMRMVTRIMHATGQWLEDDGFPLLLSKNDMQGLGSATTYARRYGLMAAVGIAPEDDDGNGAGQGDGKPVTTKERPKPRQETKPDAGQINSPSPRERAAEYADKQIAFLKTCNTHDDLLDWQGTEAVRLSSLQDKHPDLHKMVMDQYQEDFGRTDMRMAG